MERNIGAQTDWQAVAEIRDCQAPWGEFCKLFLHFDKEQIMVSAISGSSSISAASMLQSMQGKRRPDPTEMASQLFSQLDTKGQGYIEKSDLESAVSQLSSSSTGTTSSSSSTASVDEIFSALDSDSDGKVTESELSSTLQKISDELESQFNDMRMSQAMGGAGGSGGAGGMPPPPPAESADSEGFTKDELTTMASETASTDSARASFISDVAANFDEADTDENGKVSLQESIVYEQSKQSASSTSSTDSSTSSSSSASTAAEELNAKVMHRIMDLMRTYAQDSSSTTQSAATLSITA